MFNDRNISNQIFFILSFTLEILMCFFSSLLSMFAFQSALLPLHFRPNRDSQWEIFRDVIMQSAFHNLNVYTSWLHLSSQSTNTNKSIKIGYRPCLLCQLTEKFFSGVLRHFLAFCSVSNIWNQTWVWRKNTFF